MERLQDDLLPKLHEQHMADIKARAEERKKILEKQFESSDHKGKYDLTDRNPVSPTSPHGAPSIAPDALLNDAQLQDLNSRLSALNGSKSECLPPAELLAGAITEFDDNVDEMSELSEFASNLSNDDYAIADATSSDSNSTRGGDGGGGSNTAAFDPSKIEDPEMREYEMRRQLLLLNSSAQQNPLQDGIDKLGIPNNSQLPPPPPVGAASAAERPSIQTAPTVPEPPSHLNDEEKHRWRQQHLIQSGGANMLLGALAGIGKPVVPSPMSHVVQPVGQVQDTTPSSSTTSYKTMADRLKEAEDNYTKQLQNTTQPLSQSVPTAPPTAPPPPAESALPPAYPPTEAPPVDVAAAFGIGAASVPTQPAPPTYADPTPPSVHQPSMSSVPTPPSVNPIGVLSFGDSNTAQPQHTHAQVHQQNMSALAQQEEELKARIRKMEEDAARREQDEKSKREHESAAAQQTQRDAAVAQQKAIEKQQQEAAEKQQQEALRKEIAEVEKQIAMEKLRAAENKQKQQQMEHAVRQRQILEQRRQMEQAQRERQAKQLQAKSVLLPVPLNNNAQQRERLLRYWAYPRYQPSPNDQGRRGLVNLGNTCYINSVLQCLAATPIGQYFQSDAYLDHVVDRYTGGGRIANSITFVLRELRLKQESHPVSASNLKRWVAKKNDQFDNNSQQDASEFLRTLIDGLHDDVNRKAKVKVPFKDIENRNRPERVIAKDYVDAFNARNDSFVMNIFNFFERSTIVCKRCKGTSRTFTPSTSLELAIPKPQPSYQGLAGVSIQDCLSMYIRPESMTGDSRVNCPDCKAKTDAVKQLSIWSPPKILVLTLKRFKAWGDFSDKISHDVAFQPELDLGPYCYGGGDVDRANAADGPGTSRCMYDLVGVVNHQGNLSGGHYTADTKGYVDNKWFYFSDETKYLSTQASFQKAYILFYVKRKSR